ncbi:Transferase of alkyl or aryl groups [Sarracenia purpurea var. burkii]
MRLSSFLFPTCYRPYSSTKLASLLLSPPAAAKLATTFHGASTWWAQMDCATTAAPTTATNSTGLHQVKECKNNHHQYQKQKIVVIMGPTGCGKSRLSIDLASRFFPSEIINSDKMQVYRGLDITTNKIPMSDRLGVPHHLLGDLDLPTAHHHPDLTPSQFRSLAVSTISAVLSRSNLPLIVGGSNSFIYALAVNQFDPDSDVFDESYLGPVCSELQYDCCFLWVDVSIPVLNQYLAKRVDDMLDSGMFDELAEYFESEKLHDSDSTRSGKGLRKAIGVPEFEPYFKKFPPGAAPDTHPKEDQVRRVAYEEAVRAIKENTCRLAKRQVEKIMRLRSAGWDLQRLDATEAFRTAAGLCGSDPGNPSDIWEQQVVQPSVKIVKQFLEE